MSVKTHSATHSLIIQQLRKADWYAWSWYDVKWVKAPANKVVQLVQAQSPSHIITAMRAGRQVRQENGTCCRGDLSEKPQRQSRLLLSQNGALCVVAPSRQELQWVPSVFGPKKEKLRLGITGFTGFPCPAGTLGQKCEWRLRHTQLTYCFSPKNLPSK